MAPFTDWLRSYGPALLACLAVVVRIARSRHRRRAGEVAIWVVSLCIASSLVLQAPSVYRAVGEFTGVPNIARLANHGFILVAAVAGQDFLLRINRPELAKRRLLPHTIWAVTAFAAMCLFFLMSRTGVNDIRFAARYGRTPGVLEYWLVYVAGLVPALLDVARLAAWYAARSTETVIRLGLQLIAVAMLSLVLYHVHKAAFFAARRFGLDYPRSLAGPLDRYLPALSALLVIVGIVLPAWRTPVAVSSYLTHLRLRPLWLAFYTVVPRIAFVPPRSLLRELLDFRDTGLRLYRRVVEIRDGRLAVLAHLDPGIAAAARESALGAGLSGQKLDAHVEAVTLAAALRAVADGAEPPGQAAALAVPGGSDLDSDIAFLKAVATAYRRLGSGRVTEPDRHPMDEPGTRGNVRVEPPLPDLGRARSQRFDGEDGPG
ncbi:MAB_1171c family putative transporter [Amycolatopsis sp. NPDC004747]